MKIQSLRWLGASALGLSLALIPHLGLCQEADELVTAIQLAFSEDESQADAPAVDKQQQAGEPVASDEQPPAVAAEVVTDSDIAASQSEPQPARQPSTSAETTEPATQRQLSVPPLVQPYYPDNMPAWTQAPAGYVDGKYVVAVGSIPAGEREDADDALDEQLLASMYAFIDDQLIEPGASWRVRERVTVDYIRTNLIDDPLGYTVQLETSSGPMYQKWVQLVVSKEQQQQIREWHREAMQLKRIVPLGLGMIGLLTLVSGFHLLMRRGARLASKAQHDNKMPQRVELPVIKNQSQKACYSKGFAPIAFLPIPIVIAIVAANRVRDAGEREVAVERVVVVEETMDTQIVTHRVGDRTVTVERPARVVIAGE